MDRRITDARDARCGIQERDGRKIQAFDVERGLERRAADALGAQRSGCPLERQRAAAWPRCAQAEREV